MAEILLARLRIPLAPENCSLNDRLAIRGVGIMTQTRKRDSFEVEEGKLDVVLWAEANEEECQGNDIAMSRSCTPYGKWKGARRSAKSAGRWEYRCRRFTAGSGDTRDWD